MDTNLSALLAELDALRLRLDAARPLSLSALRQLREDWEITHTYHSNAIEGSTLTLGETKAILLDGVTVSGKPLREHLEAVNHREAMRLMTRLAKEAAPLREADILELHRTILTGIQSDEAGRYRSVRVRIAGSAHVFPNSLKVPELMSAFVQKVNAFEGHEALRAVRAHYDFVAIHPFIDGNGRTARLLMNLLLLREGYVPALLIVEQRGAYYDALESANMGDSLPFEILMLQTVVHSLKDVLEFVT